MALALSLRDRVALVTRAFLPGAMPTDPKTVGGRLLAGVIQAGGQPPTRGTREQLLGFSQMPWLHAVVSRISADVASTEWLLYVKRRQGGKYVLPSGKAVLDAHVRRLQRAPRELRAKMVKAAVEAGDLEPLPSHPLLDLLHGFNTFHTGLAARRVTQQHLDLVGEAFWLLERDRRGMPIALWPIAPSWILGTPTVSRPVFRVSFRGWQGEIPATEIIWFCDLDPANPYGRGVGTAQALADELETDEYAAKHVKAYFYNRARPDLIVSPKLADGEAGMQESEVQRLEEGWVSRSSGFWRCHDSETEALTREGWKLGVDLLPNDEIATWDESLGRIVFQSPTAVYRYPYDGVMHRWVGDRFDALVTPNHRMWWATKDGLWRYEESADLSSRGGPIQMRQAGTYNGAEVATVEIPASLRAVVGRPFAGYAGEMTLDARAFAPFVGYMVSEGSVETTRVRISQFGQNDRKSRIVSRIAESLAVFPESLVSTYTHQDNPHAHEWTVTHKGLAAWCAAEIGMSAQEKRLPSACFEWPLGARLALLDALVDGDGQSNGMRSMVYWTTSPRLADDVQRLAVLCGYRAAKVSYSAQTPRGVVPAWRVPIMKAGTRWLQRGTATPWMREERYVGDVWCVSVPNGNLLTRRNGCVLLSGNSFKPFFLRRPVEIKELDQNLRAQQFVQLREYERNTIIQVYGVSPEILGIVASGANRATITMAEYLYARRTLVPRLEFQRAVQQERLVPLFDERIVLDYVNPVARDVEVELEAGKVAPYALTVNEWRARMGEPALEGGDVHVIPPSLEVVERLEPAAPSVPAVPEDEDLPLNLPPAGAAEEARWRSLRMR